MAQHCGKHERGSRRLACVALLMSLIGLTACGRRELSVQQIYDRSVKAVVSIKTPTGEGSGFLIAPEGTVVTNYHVIRGDRTVTVEVKGRAGVDAHPVESVIAYDATRDYAVLKIAAINLPEVPLGDSDDVKRFDPVVAIGSPAGLEDTPSEGKVTQFRDAGGYTHFQIDANIAPGSSGGPLFNRNGEVIGITTSGRRGPAGTTYAGLNFAVPINYVRAALREKRKELTLTEVAAEEDARDLEEFKKMFTGHDDPLRWYTAVYPKNWLVQRCQSSSTTDNVVRTRATTVFVPRDAEHRVCDGYVSAGIRITFRFPAEGRDWTINSVDESTAWFLEQMRTSNSDFKVIREPRQIQVAGRDARMFAMEGKPEKISEPEQAIFVYVPTKRYLMSIELVSPKSKIDGYMDVFDFFIGNLRLTG